MVRISAVAAVALLLTVPAGAQQPDIGIKPLELTQPSYTFDTAEQHGIKVSVLAKGFARPFAIEFLPGGDLLIAERGSGVRVLHDAAGANPQLDPALVTGVPEAGRRAVQHRHPGHRAAPGLRRQPLALLDLQRSGGAARRRPDPAQPANRAAHADARQARERPGHRRRDAVPGRRLRGAGVTARVRPRRQALPDNRRRLRADRAGSRHDLRQGAAAQRRRLGPGGQSLRRPRGGHPGDLFLRPPRPARPRRSTPRPAPCSTPSTG